MWVLSSSSRKILIEEHGFACMWSDSCLSSRALTLGGFCRVIIWLPCEDRALLLTCEFVTTSGQLAWKAGGSSLGTPLLQKPSCRLGAWTQQLCLNTGFTWNLIVWAVKYIPTVKVGIPHSVVSDSLQPHELQPTRRLCPWDSPGKNTRVGCYARLQGIFLT